MTVNRNLVSGEIEGVNDLAIEKYRAAYEAAVRDREETVSDGVRSALLDPLVRSLVTVTYDEVKIREGVVYAGGRIVGFVSRVSSPAQLMERLTAAKSEGVRAQEAASVNTSISVGHVTPYVAL